MSANLPPKPTATERKKLSGLRVILIVIAVLVVLAVLGYGFLDLGQAPTP